MRNDPNEFFAPPPSKELDWTARWRGREELSGDDIDEMLASLGLDPITGKPCVHDVSERAAGIEEEAGADIYRFPDITCFMEPHNERTSKELLVALRKLSHEQRDAGGNRCPYFEVREELCAISILLNERGDYAPRVRGMRIPISPKKSRSPYPVDEQALSNDRQVIDLHWLYYRRVVARDTPGYEGMLDSKLQFDWLRASSFVNRVGSVEKKASLLGLTEYTQLQLAAIQTKQVSDRWRTIREGLQKQQGMILSAAHAPSARLDAEGISRLPDIYLALHVARESPGLATEAYQWIAGKKINRKEMSRRQQWMRRLGVLPMQAKSS